MSCGRRGTPGDAERRIALYKELRITGRSVINCGCTMAFQRIRPLSGAERLYEPDASGREAIVVPIVEDGPRLYPVGEPDEEGYIAAGFVADLVAFHPEQPERWWRRTGHGVVLGSWTLERAEWLEEVLFVYSNPLAFLKAECRGVCIIDWQVAPLRLVGIKSIECDNFDLGVRIERALQPPSDLPDIRITEAA